MLIRRVADLHAVDLAAYDRPARASGVLLCPPDHFQVQEPINPYMQGRQGTVDPGRARAQWEALRAALEAAGLEVFTLAPRPELPDLVFTANPSLAGVDRAGRPFAIISRMRHASRRPEVEHHRSWHGARGTRMVELPDELDGACWEGGGDGVWHPGRFHLWAGVGPRSDERAAAWLAGALDLPVAVLRLGDPACYHLDTCLAPLGPGRAAWVPGAFDADGRALLQAVFPKLLEIDPAEARGSLAANLYCPNGERVLLPANAPRTRAKLQAEGYEVIELDTGEFLKSGGSVTCLRQELCSGRDRPPDDRSNPAR